MKFVLVRSVLDFSAVLEFDCFATFDVEVERVHVNTCRETRIARPGVELVGSNVIDVRDRWVMADLLKEHIRSICKLSLESLAEDRVERLVENVAWL